MNRIGDARSAIIVGAGPVGCLVGARLQKLGIATTILESGQEEVGPGDGTSFNLTLTKRGLSGLPAELLDRIIEIGQPLLHRVIHHEDQRWSRQSYGHGDDHYLLSVPRHSLTSVLRRYAVESGCELHFGETGQDVDPFAGAVTAGRHDGQVRQVVGDLVIACDGARSRIRGVLAERGLIKMFPRSSGMGHFEMAARPADEDSQGMHLWPRGRAFVQSQPNVDGTYTTSVFAQMEGWNPSPDHVLEWLRSVAPDLRVSDHQPATFGQLRPLRVVRVSPYHCRRVILVGDAAHTMTPFFGQGINCSFEDVNVLVRLLEGSASPPPRAARVGSLYSAERVAAGWAVEELSNQNFHELSVGVDDPHRRGIARIEGRLHVARPDLYRPSYEMVAFSNIPYNEVQEVIGRQKRTLAQALQELVDENLTELADRYQHIASLVEPEK